MQIVATGLGLQQLSLSKAAAAAAGGSSSSSSSQQQQGQQEELLVVSFVVDGSAAAQAGVQQGDAVLTVAGQPVAGKELR
jgi:C-terminal processing protease CtpA/Prc